jgi:prepilin peptidase CpaA
MTQSKKLLLYNMFLGAFAVAAQIWLFSNHHDNIAISFASLYLILICVYDSIYSKIPNVFSLSLLAFAFWYNLSSFGINGFLYLFAVLFAGIMLLIVPFLLGGMGAGDVKALGALGALIGPTDVFHIFAYMGIIGGAIGLGQYAVSGNLKLDIFRIFNSVRVACMTKDIRILRPSHKFCTQKFPYATALALGFLAFIIRGKII